MPPRVAIVPPAPAPYREPLFALLAERGVLRPCVVYQSGAQPGWDQRPDWFPREHAYESLTLGSTQRARPGRTPVLLPRGLGRALSGLDPDVVVSWEYGAATLRGLAWCRRRRRPLVIFSELTAAAASELSPLRRRLHRLLAPRAAGFVVASGAARSRVVSLGVPPARVEVSVQSADVDGFREAAEAGGRGARAGRAVRFLAVGRLVPDKNLELLIEALPESGAELELVGKGPVEERLRSRAAELEAPVRFRGYVPPAELPRVMAEADAFVLVSLYEPFGAAVREAAAAGLPIVCSRLAGAAGEVAVERENALLVDARSRDEVAAALEQLASDAALRERLAEGSRRLTERRPLTADAEAFERAVLRALSCPEPA